MKLLKKSKPKPKTPEVKTAPAKTNKKNPDEEIAAVISAAIYLYTQQQNGERADLKMTIKRTDRPYTPWSQKIYMMRKWPR